VLPALGFAQMRAPHCRSAARLLRTTSRSRGTTTTRSSSARKPAGGAAVAFTRKEPLAGDRLTKGTGGQPRIGTAAGAAEILVSRETLAGVETAFRLSEPRTERPKGFEHPIVMTPEVFPRFGLPDALPR
jgi:hypothetical protein